MYLQQAGGIPLPLGTQGNIHSLGHNQAFSLGLESKWAHKVFPPQIAGSRFSRKKHNSEINTPPTAHFLGGDLVDKHGKG